MSELEVNQDLRANYDEYYEGPSEWRRLGAIDKANNIVDLCGAFPHAEILEIGAGEGSILEELSARGFGNRLYAAEISKTAVDVIRKRGIRTLTDCRQFDGYHLPFQDRAFDVAILSHVIEHVEHPRQLLYEAKRVAQFVFVEVPLEDTVRLPRDFVPDRVGHINFYSPKTIRRLVQSCGLQVLHEVVRNSSRRVFEYHGGLKGVAKYAIKELLVTLVPSLAVRLFTFNMALICRSR